MKRTFYAVLTVLAFFLIIVLVLPRLIDASLYQKPVQEFMRSHYGLDFQIRGGVQLSILPYPQVSISNVELIEVGSRNELISVDHASVSLDVGALMQGRVSVKSLLLSDAKIKLVQGEDGAFLGLPTAIDNSSTKAEPVDNENKSLLNNGLMLNNVRFQNISFEYWPYEAKHPVSLIVTEMTLNGDINETGLNVNASLSYEGIDASLTSLVQKNEDMNYQLSLHADAYGAHISYVGTASTLGSIQTQGKIDVQLSELLHKVLKKIGVTYIRPDVTASYGGIINVNKDVLMCPDCTIMIANQAISAPINYSISNGRGSMNIKTVEAFQLMPVLMKQASVDIDNLILELPVEFTNEPRLNINKPAMIQLGSQKNEPTLEAYIKDSRVVYEAGLHVGALDLQFLSGLLKQEALFDVISKSKTRRASFHASNIDGSEQSKIDFTFDGLTLSLSQAGLLILGENPTKLIAKIDNAAKFFEKYFDIEIVNTQYEEPFTINADLYKETQKYIARDLAIKTGNTALKALFSCDFSDGVDLSLHVDFDDFYVPIIKRNSQHFGAKDMQQNKAGVARQNVVSNIAVNTPFNAKVTLKGQRLIVDSVDIKDVNLSAHISDDILNVNALEMHMFNGNATGSGELNLGNFDMRGSFAFKQVDVEQLSRYLLGSSLINLTGKVDLNASLSGNISGSQGFLTTSNGYGIISGTDFVLNGVDLTRFATSLSSDLKFKDSLENIWSGVSQGGETSFDVLSGAFKLQKGVLTSNDLLLDGTALSILNKGRVDLVASELATTHSITLKRDRSPDPFDINFSGSLSNPQKTFGEALLKDFLNRKVQRKFDKLLSDKLGVDNKSSDATASDYDNEAPTIEDAAKEALKNAIGDLFQ